VAFLHFVPVTCQLGSLDFPPLLLRVSRRRRATPSRSWRLGYSSVTGTQVAHILVNGPIDEPGAPMKSTLNPANLTDDPLLTPTQVAEMLGVTRRCVERWIMSGEFEPVLPHLQRSPAIRGLTRTSGSTL
jgi:hypothetical protein